MSHWTGTCAVQINRLGKVRSRRMNAVPNIVFFDLREPDLDLVNAGLDAKVCLAQGRQRDWYIEVMNDPQSIAWSLAGRRDFAVVSQSRNSIVFLRGMD